MSGVVWHRPAFWSCVSFRTQPLRYNESQRILLHRNLFLAEGRLENLLATQLGSNRIWRAATCTGGKLGFLPCRARGVSRRCISFRLRCFGDAPLAYYYCRLTERLPRSSALEILN